MGGDVETRLDHTRAPDYRAIWALLRGTEDVICHVQTMAPRLSSHMAIFELYRRMTNPTKTNPRRGTHTAHNCVGVGVQFRIHRAPEPNVSRAAWLLHNLLHREAFQWILLLLQHPFSVHGKPHDLLCKICRAVSRTLL
jgi:hypothetical protein